MNATQDSLPASVWKETGRVFDDTMADSEFNSSAQMRLEAAVERGANFGGVGQVTLRATIKNSRHNIKEEPAFQSRQREGVRELADVHPASYDLNLRRTDGQKVKDADDLLAPEMLTDVLGALEQQLAVLEGHLSILESHLNQK